MVLIEVVCIFATLFAITYSWCRYNYSYWKRNGIPYLEPLPLLGNAKVMFTMSKSFFLYLSDIYKDPKMSNAAAVGVYALTRPILVLREPELIKLVMIKEFQKFTNRSGRPDPHADVLGANSLFFARNLKWKELRIKFTPMYTTSKIKQLYLLMREVGSELESHLTKQGPSFVSEIKEICALYTTDVIALIAFGVQANSLKNPNGEFRKQGREVFNFTLSRAKDFLITSFYPEWASTFRAKFITPEFSAFVRNTIEHVMAEREKTNVKRNDLIDVLVDMKKEAQAKGEHDKAFRDVLAAQAAIFLTAGFETSSSTMAFALYEMAKHQDLQERLRNEICEAFIAENGELSYETLSNLPYLSMVLDETLRMYPVLPALEREHDPTDGDAPFDLRPYYDYTVPKNMAIYVPIYGLQHDAKYWPNPETFDPERFTPENKQHHEQMAYLPFGTGPRKCVGNRIGLLQSKVGLAHFLKNHCVKCSDKTPENITFDPFSGILQYKYGIYLNIINDGLYDRKAGKN